MTLNNTQHDIKNIYAIDYEEFDENIVNKRLNDFIKTMKITYPTNSFADTIEKV